MNTILNYAMLADDIYQQISKNPAGYFRLSRYSITHPIVAAAYYKSHPDPLVIAFRGSVTPADWGDADAEIVCHSYPTEYVGTAFDFFDRVICAPNIKRDRTRRIAIVGHSLGGALAAIVAARLTTRPVIGVTFNAPPIDALMSVGGYREPPEASPAYGSSDRDREGGLADLVRGVVSDEVSRWKLAQVVSGASGAKARLNIPRTNARSLHHVRISVDGDEDIVSKNPVLGGTTLGKTYRTIRISRSEIVQRAAGAESAERVSDLVARSTRPLVVAPIASIVKRTASVVAKLTEAHYMANVVKALTLPENADVAMVQPSGW